MKPEEIERFEAAAGDLLDELGYPRLYRRPSPEAAQQAARIREVFESLALSPRPVVGGHASFVRPGYPVTQGW